MEACRQYFGQGQAMYIDFEQYSSMQYRIKALEGRVRELESGEAYRKMAEGQRRQRAYYERELRRREKEAADARQRESRNLAMWFQVFQDIQAECERKVAESRRREQHMRDMYQSSLEEVEKLRGKLRKKTDEAVQARASLQEEKEKNQKLQAQANMDFENSSTPSSQVPFRKKVQNNRERTGRKPGAQPGHEAHRRKPHAVNGGSVFLAAPPEIENSPDYYRQKGAHAEVHKQVVSVRLAVTVTDYWSYTYRNRNTGAKYHPPFPENAQLEVNYDESVKALIFLMKDHFNMPENKIAEFFRTMTGGEVCLSRGMINGINGEFSAKTEAERRDIFARLARTGVLYTDMTGARMNGELKNVVTCTDGKDILYFFRDSKGDQAFQGTPVEICTNVLVHDHDKTMYHYGGAHQECNEHHLRYLKGAMENEPELTWHGKMRGLLQEMNTVREKQGRELTTEQVEEFEGRYDEILDLADKEYYDHPPSAYYRKGYNLSVEFREYKEAVLLFLHNPTVDFTNNISERGCRKVKRHQAVSGTFRGDTNRSGEEYCDAMGVLQTARAKEENVYEMAKEVFQREGHKKPRNKDKKEENTTKSLP